MKNLLKSIFVSSFLFFSISSYSQFEAGLKFGISSIDVVSNGINVDNGIHNLKINLGEAEYGYHFGLYTRLSFLGIYLEPAVLFNSNSVNYQIDNFGESPIVGEILSEKYQNLSVPVLIGIKAGFLRLSLGPVAHVHIDSSSDLFNIDGYEQRFKDASYGIIGGIGLDIWKLRLDLQYEANLSEFGDHIVINGEEYSFGDQASRVLGTVSWRF